ncbi:hypothetical protein A3709_18750 [Halioglobus sp. HI00S01]|uniref:hypothetical protein n=1 Tax=Halioglobus sp. HI00S01 TaxID=1822214 RepID=UPI0007C31F44|nr:hypothetical protein [Halioglobus sp. HI00S01]KZX57664.1 hypothetical protein A3709_18750 [Halioglobus sp. HI00S01]
MQLTISEDEFVAELEPITSGGSKGDSILSCLMAAGEAGAPAPETEGLAAMHSKTIWSVCDDNRCWVLKLGLSPNARFHVVANRPGSDIPGDLLRVFVEGSSWGVIWSLPENDPECYIASGRGSAEAKDKFLRDVPGMIGEERPALGRDFSIDLVFKVTFSARRGIGLERDDI